MVIELKQPARSERIILLRAAKKAAGRYLKEEGMTKEEIIKVLHPFLLYLKRYGLESTGNSLKINHDFATLLMQLIGKLTPREIMTYYPIIKDFKAEKYEIKGYRHTMEYLKTLDMDKPIGTTPEEVITFIWEYRNPYFMALGLAHMKTLDTFQAIRGQYTGIEMLEHGSRINQAPQFTVIKGGTK